MSSANLADLLYRHADKAPDALAIIHRDRVVTYRELAANVSRRAAAFSRKGISSGDRVLVFVPMSIALYEILLALFHIGATAVFLDAWADKKRFDDALTIADCRGFIGIPKSFLLMLTQPRLRRLPARMTHLTPIFRRASVPSSRLDPDAPALITFTTGSTGRPKAALRTHGFLLEQHKALVRELAQTPGETDLTALPIFVLNNLAGGVASLIPDFDPRFPAQINPAKVLAEMERHNVVSASGSPAFFAALAEGMTQGRIPELKRIYTGGAPVFPDLARHLAEAFPQAGIEILYGSTEAEPIAAVSAAELAEMGGVIAKEGLPAGYPVPGLKLVVIPFNTGDLPEIDEEGWAQFILPPGEPGEICVAGAHVLKSYFNSPEAMRANKISVGCEVFHRTGDAGAVMKDGSIRLLGRAREIVEINRKRVFPMIAEYLLRRIDGVRCATLIKRDGKAVIFAEYLGRHNQLLEAVTKAGIDFDELRIIDHIPRDPRHNSKIDYDKLRLEP